MAEGMKPSQVQEFLFNHGEKLALGAAAAALLAYVLGILMAKDDPNAKELDRNIDRVKQELTGDHPDKWPPEAKALDQGALKPWEEVATAKAGHDWAGTLPPQIQIKIIPKPKVVPRPVKIPEVKFGSTEVALDGIMLAWSASGFTFAEMQKDKGTDYVRLSHCKIEREVGGSGKWETVAEKIAASPPAKNERDIKPESWKWTDNGIQARTKYSYRITAYCTDPKVTKDKPNGQVATVGTGSPVMTLGIWKVRFANLIPAKPDAEPPVPGQAYIEIEKYDRQAGQKVKITLIHHDGDMIGGKVVAPGAAPDFVHRVPDPKGGGRSIKVDFNTGMKLLSVKQKRITKDVPWCRPRFEGSTKVGCDEGVNRVSLDVSEALYIDEEGQKIVYLHPDPNTHALFQDKRCAEHAGKK